MLDILDTGFDLETYRKRIGDQGPLVADSATLRRLMRRQLFTIPFENLDVLAGREISLEPATLVDKLIRQQRGGYCYELNGLFAMALSALGFRYRFLAARPLHRAANRPKTHAALAVEADGQDWLVDLGFGSFGVREPLRLDTLNVAVPQDDETFRLTRDPDGGDYVLAAWLEGQWQDQYSFDQSPQRWVDFATGNYFNAMHPASIFRQQPMLLRFTPEGRNILFADRLTQVIHGQSHKRQLADGELVQVLPGLFGLAPDTLPASVLAPAPQRAADTLGMAAADMRRLGYWVVDRVVERQVHRDQEPAIRTGDPENLQALLGGAIPEQPMDAEQSLALLAEVALDHQQHGDHPRYFARVPGPASFAAILGEWLGTGFNTIASSWGGGSGPAMVETVVIGWLAQLLGMPPETEGVLQSGGSLANLTAFLVARQETGAGERGVAYLTDQSHASLVRNLQHMGLPERQVRILPSDPDYRMDVEALTQAIHEDRAAGLVPMLVVASAGTTNTGAVDPLPVLASLCERESIWFHVDGAYGAPAALTPAGRAYLAGLARADSLVLDPHKWLFQPYDAGLCLIRRPGALERCFAMYPEYLRDAQGRQQSVASFGNRSLELSRRSRALKLWLSLRTYGVARFRTAIQRGIERAEQAEALLRAQPDVWEVVSPARIGIVCFALRGAAEGEHARRAQALAESGFACLSSTRLKGREVLRLCTINPLTTADDLRETLVRLAGELRLG